MKRVYWLAILIAYGLIIFYLSSLVYIPMPTTASSFTHSDKLYHGVVFFIFGYFIMKVCSPTTIKQFLCVLLFSLMYAASDEIHQSFVPGRSCNLSDWIINSAGILMLGIIYYGQRFKVLKNKRK